jgi:hypothetical protein
MAAMNALLSTVIVADTVTNSAGVACLPSAPHDNDTAGVPEAPTNAPSSAAPCPDDAIDNALLIDDRLSECTQESHLSACTAETHVSVITAETHVSAITEETHVRLITEDSMLNMRPLSVAEEVASSWDGAENPESISAHGLAQCVIVVLTNSNETHIIPPDSVNRSPNEPMVDSDTPGRIRLSAVSNRVVAGLGGDTGSYGPPTVSTHLSAEGEVGMRVHPVNPMNHSNMNPNDGDGFGSTSQPTRIDYACAPTINHAPATLHVPPVHEEEFNTPVSRQIDRTPNNYVTAAGGDGCNSGRMDNQGWSDNIEAHDIGQNVYATRNSGEAANAFLAQGFHLDRCPDAEDAERQEPSQAQWADGREQGHNIARVRTCDDPSWENLFTKGTSLSQKDLIGQRTETSGKGEGNVGQTPSRLRQLARDDGPGVTNDLNPTSGKGRGYTGRSPNRLHQLVRDNNLDVADNAG